MSGKRQTRTVGAILRVPLDERWHTYALTLDDPDFAFFDAKTDGELGPEEIVRRAVLFRLFVFKSAVTKGRWQKVGKAAVPPELSQPSSTFIQDALCPDRFDICVGGARRPATLEECEGLERCAVWVPEHVEERIRDHYAGVPNRWAESMRPNRLVGAVRDVLLTKWNPLSVSGPEASRTYDGYIEGISRKMKAGFDAVAEHLYALETISMRLPGDRKRCERAAKGLIAIAKQSTPAR